jgi:23S rRNA pseudouridine955/2504/2580 synthase
MNSLSKESATWHEIGAAAEGQRVDNYLVRLLKGVPKSHVYRMLRSGEVRVNSGRVGPDHRLKAGDRVRVPPVRVSQRTETPQTPRSGRVLEVLYEDESLLALNKPAGLAVHGGSGVSFGVIEQLRHERAAAPFLELAHRLDRDTSGVLLLAKKRSALLSLHEQMRTGSARKYYLALVRGEWTKGRRKVALPLHKYALPGGERRVKVSETGAESVTIFRLQWTRSGHSLVEAELKTGRTHQIRVHLAHLGHPIAGDDKYGDYAANRDLARLGLKRMFLHAWRLVVRHPTTEKPIAFEAPLPSELSSFLACLETPRAPAAL